MTLLALHISVYLADLKAVGLKDSIYSYSLQMLPMFVTVSAF